MTMLLTIIGFSTVLTILSLFLIAQYPDQFSWIFRGKLISPEEMISHNKSMDIADMEADEAEGSLEEELTKYMAMYNEIQEQYDYMVKENLNLTTELDTAQNVNTVYNERLKRLLDNLRTETITTKFMRRTKPNIRDFFIQKLNAIQNHLANLKTEEI